MRREIKGKVCPQGRENFKARGQKEKVVEGKGEGEKGKEKEAMRKRKDRPFNMIDQNEINEFLYHTAWMEAAAYFLRRY